MQEDERTTEEVELFTMRENLRWKRDGREKAGMKTGTGDPWMRWNRRSQWGGSKPDPLVVSTAVFIKRLPGLH